MQDVAELAGVSVATVSRILNGIEVRPETKVKVEEAIKKLNYEPNMLGRSLRTSESRLLLVLIPAITNPFYHEIIKGIETVALANSYNILLCETDSKPEREDIYFNLVKNKIVDGVITMDPAVNKEKLIDLSKRYPIVQCSEYSVDSGIPYVTIDNERAAYKAVELLIKLGHKDIALINSESKFLYARQRELGFRKAIKDSDLNFNDENVYYSKNISFDSGTKIMRTILNDQPQTTAVFAVSDLLAIGALKEINSKNLKVPDDIALIGFDGIPFSNMTYPTLTTIAQPMYEMGIVAVDMLIKKIKGEIVESIILDHQLVVGEST